MWFVVGTAQSGVQARDAQRLEEGVRSHCGSRCGLTVDQTVLQPGYSMKTGVFDMRVSVRQPKVVYGLLPLNIVVRATDSSAMLCMLLNPSSRS